MDSAGLVDVTVFQRHEGVVAFQVPPSVPDGTHEAKGRHSISMTHGSISALATAGSRAPLPRDAAAFRATWRLQRESSGFSR